VNRTQFCFTTQQSNQNGQVYIDYGDKTDTFRQGSIERNGKDE